MCFYLKTKQTLKIEGAKENGLPALPSDTVRDQCRLGIVLVGCPSLHRLMISGASSKATMLHRVQACGMKRMVVKDYSLRESQEQKWKRERKEEYRGGEEKGAGGAGEIEKGKGREKRQREREREEEEEQKGNKELGTNRSFYSRSPTCIF